MKMMHAVARSAIARLVGNRDIRRGHDDRRVAEAALHLRGYGPQWPFRVATGIKICLELLFKLSASSHPRAASYIAISRGGITLGFLKPQGVARRTNSENKAQHPGHGKPSQEHEPISHVEA